MPTEVIVDDGLVTKGITLDRRVLTSSDLDLKLAGVGSIANFQDRTIVRLANRTTLTLRGEGQVSQISKGGITVTLNRI